MTQIERDALFPAMRSNKAEFHCAQVRLASANTVEEHDGLALFAVDCDWAIGVSGALRTEARLRGADVLARAAEFFSRRYEGGREHGYTIFTSHHDDADIDIAAKTAGLVMLSESPGMVAFERVRAQIPHGVELRQVSGAKDATDFAAVSAEAYASYGMPACVAEAMFAEPRSLTGPTIAAFVASVDGVPASAAMVLVSHGAGYVAWVGTTVAARGKGLAAVVTSAVTNAAFDRDARFVWLEASPMGESVYRKLGYEEVTRYRWWVRPPQS